MTADADGNTVTALGLSSRNNLITLRNLQLDMKATRTLEVGLAHAASALVFTQTTSDIGPGAGSTHVAIDPFQSAHLKNAGVRAIEASGNAARFRLIEDFSDRALPKLLEAGERFDIIYIDGSHLIEDVLIDMHYSTQLLEVGGMMLFDDCADPHVAKALAFARSNLRHCLDEAALAQYRADGGQTARYRVAQLLGRSQMRGFRKIAGHRRPWNSPLGRF